MKVDLEMSTYTACLVALRVRAIESRAEGKSDSRWIKAYELLTQAVYKSIEDEAGDETNASMPFHPIRGNGTV